MVRLSAGCSLCRDRGDRGAGGGLIIDGLVRGERCDERLDGEVVDLAG